MASAPSTASTSTTTALPPYQTWINVQQGVMNTTENNVNNLNTFETGSEQQIATNLSNSRDNTVKNMMDTIEIQPMAAANQTWKRLNETDWVVVDTAGNQTPLVINDNECGQYGFNNISQQKCDLFVSECLTNGDIKGCARLFNRVDYLQQARNDISKLHPDAALDILRQFGFQRVRTTNSNGSITDRVQTVREWLNSDHVKSLDMADQAAIINSTQWLQYLNLLSTFISNNIASTLNYKLNSNDVKPHSGIQMFKSHSQQPSDHLSRLYETLRAYRPQLTSQSIMGWIGGLPGIHLPGRPMFGGNQSGGNGYLGLPAGVVVRSTGPRSNVTGISILRNLYKQFEETLNACGYHLPSSTTSNLKKQLDDAEALEVRLAELLIAARAACEERRMSGDSMTSSVKGEQELRSMVQTIEKVGNKFMTLEQKLTKILSELAKISSEKAAKRGPSSGLSTSYVPL